MAGILGMQDVNSDMMSTKLDEMMGTIRQVNEQFKNAASLKRNIISFVFHFCPLICTILCKFKSSVLMK